MTARHAGLAILTLLLVLTLLPSQHDVMSVNSLRADIIAVWQHQDLLICSPYPACVFDDWDIWYSFWDGVTGAWWTPTGSQAAPLAKFEGDDIDPAVAFDRNGNAMVVWAHNQSQQFDVYYSSWSGASWSMPAVVDALTGDDTDPVVAFDENGYALVLWVHDDSSIYYALWNGAGWTGRPVGQRIVRDWPSNFNGTSLPEVAFTSTSAPTGSYTTHQALAVWTQLYQDPIARSRIYYSLWNGVSWAPSPPVAIPGQVENTTLGDGPIATYRNGLSPDSQGNAVAVWGTASSENPLYNSVWDGPTGTWATTSSFTPKGTTPAVAYGPQGWAIAVYSSLTVTGQIDIWESQYSQGVWAAGSRAADSSVWDRRPSIVSFGTRAVALWWVEHPTFRNSEVFYTIWNSSDNSWSPASSLVGNIRPPFPLQPSGLQGNDRNPAVASNTGSPTMPPSTYDLVLVALLAERNMVYEGVALNPLKVTATVKNEGAFDEASITVTFKANSTTIGSASITSLSVGSSATASIDWNTNLMARGKYILSAEVSQVLGETNSANNNLSDGVVQVRLAGDVNGDGKVNLDDLLLVYVHQNTFDLIYDVNMDGKVNLDDLLLVYTHQGAT